MLSRLATDTYYLFFTRFSAFLSARKDSGSSMLNGECNRSSTINSHFSSYVRTWPGSMASAIKTPEMFCLHKLFSSRRIICHASLQVTMHSVEFSPVLPIIFVNNIHCHEICMYVQQMIFY